MCSGILCISPPHLQIGDSVSIVADVRGKCLRGSKTFSGDLCHVGEGVLNVTRDELFRNDVSVTGVGVTVTKKMFPCPSLNESSFSGMFMLQNLPSIIAVDVLGTCHDIPIVYFHILFVLSDPLPGESVLDMCAAPGGKTTHIAARMKNAGVVTAFDKSENKIAAINRNCIQLGITNVKTFVMDGTKSVRETLDTGSDVSATTFPPFPEESFDRILLDAPCSGLGQRPQFFNKIKIKELRSFPKIQRKLFSAAVRLLRRGGVMVYSTCTNNTAENEDMVTWAGEEFKCLELQMTKNYGHPTSDTDTITFFMAKFTKTR